MENPLSDEALLAWSAGFLDGEGTIGIARKKLGRSHVLRLATGQIRREPLERLQAVLGGWINTQPRLSLRGHSPYWQWVLEGLAAYNALVKLLPYLVVKRPQAELALAFQAGIDTKKRGHAYIPSAEEIARREYYKEAISVLNGGNGKLQARVVVSPEEIERRLEHARQYAKNYYAANRDRWAGGYKPVKE